MEIGNPLPAAGATQLTSDELQALRYAKHLLESPSLAARLAATLGAPIEKGLRLLPDRCKGFVQQAVNASLMRALDLAVFSLGRRLWLPPRERFHRVAVTATGAAGGAFGLPGLLIELPISTTLMLRSIADVARSQGEDLRHLESRLACLEVLALGGPSTADDTVESGYFAVRTALASAVSEAARYIAERGVVEKGAPALVRLVTAIGGRFGIAVSEKAMASAVPLIGALGGAIINATFIRHFQDVARGHFIVRRLERGYGQSQIQAAYQQL